jgi:hypothetical protein
MTFSIPRAITSHAVITLALLVAACSPDSSNITGASRPVGSIAGSGVTSGSRAVATAGFAAPSSGAPVTSGAAGAFVPNNPPSAGVAGAIAPNTPIMAPGGTAGVAGPNGPGTAGARASMAGAAAPKPAVVVTPDQKLPPVTDYAAPGPFPGREIDNTGPGGSYTMFRPSSLDANGFKFIPATWGNGITTTPQYYPWLTTVASHGFVIIASNSSTVTPDDMTKGLDWLIMQNDLAGDLQGKLDTSRAVCIGYSLGGGGAVTCGAHPKVIATVAMHPAAGVPNGLHGPLLLFSGTNDTVCVPETFVQPVFTGSPVPTFFGMLDGADHLEPVLGGRETAPFIAWLRLWVFGDENAKPFFYGADCTLCKAPWTKPQSKMLQ